MDEEQKNALIDHYSLSEKEIDRAAANSIPTYTDHLSKQKEPVIVFTGGQAGAGKSSITEIQKSRFNKDLAIIDSDIYRKNHPKNQEIQSLYPTIASSLTHQAGAKISNRVRDAAFDKGANILFDQTSRVPNGIKAIAERGKNQATPYKVELHVMATDTDTSRMRNHARYEKDNGAAGGGRYVPEQFQKTSYDGVGDTVKKIEDDKSVDRIVLYDKKARVIYDNSLKDGEWLNKPEAHKKFVEERERELTVIEKKELEQGWQKIKFQMDQRQAKITEPEIVKIANEGMQKAIDRRSIHIKDPEIAKPGRTYSGDMTVASDNAVLQQQKNGRAIIHSMSSITGFDKETDIGKSFKVSYDKDGKGSASNLSKMSMDKGKEIKLGFDMEK